MTGQWHEWKSIEFTIKVENAGERKEFPIPVISLPIMESGISERVSILSIHSDVRKLCYPDSVERSC